MPATTRRIYNQLPEKFAFYLLFLLAVQALLLPILGPWLDYDFAQYQPQHKHIYLDNINLNHHENEDSSVVNLPTLEVVSRGSGIHELLFDLISILPAESESKLAFSLLNIYLPSQSASLPLPDKPPRP
jgi:hypothetical protein